MKLFYKKNYFEICLFYKEIGYYFSITDNSVSYFSISLNPFFFITGNLFPIIKVETWEDPTVY